MRKEKIYFYHEHIIWTHCTKNIFSFSKCSEKIVFPKKPHWHMIFPVFSGYLVLSFLYYQYFPSIIWSFILSRWYFFFLQIRYYPFVKKAKMDFSQNNTTESDISGIIEKDNIFILWKYGISSDRKIKDDKKVYF